MENNGVCNQIPAENIVDHLIDPFFAKFDIKVNYCLGYGYTKFLPMHNNHKWVSSNKVFLLVVSMSDLLILIFQFKRALIPDSSKKLNLKVSEFRIMDTEIQRVVDPGYCISLHQPWASFLVLGIKTYVEVLPTLCLELHHNTISYFFSGEGRTWYTSYRGKLWIASSSTRVSRPEIEKCENTYRYIQDSMYFHYILKKKFFSWHWDRKIGAWILFVKVRS